MRSLASYTGDPALAEELAQEALARAWERWDRYAPAGAASSMRVTDGSRRTPGPIVEDVVMPFT